MVVIFGLGIVAGIVLIIKLIKTAMDKFRPQMILLIIGLMLGSLYAIVMGPTTLDTPQPYMTWHTFSIVFFIIGGVVIVGLQLLKSVMEKRQ